jgi:hypothetical protein
MHLTTDAFGITEVFTEVTEKINLIRNLSTENVSQPFYFSFIESQLSKLPLCNSAKTSVKAAGLSVVFYPEFVEGLPLKTKCSGFFAFREEVFVSFVVKPS